MRSTPLMACGHAANAKTETGKPVCVICYEIADGADREAESSPDLTGRFAQCSYCKTLRSSSLGLAFFNYRVGQPTDEYYCGCYGWN